MNVTPEQARAELEAKVSAMTTQALLDADLMLSIAPPQPGTALVSFMMETELEKRLPASEFLAHMDAIETALGTTA